MQTHPKASRSTRSYPPGFFDGVKTVRYQPAREKHNDNKPFQAPDSYPWQSRPSPVNIDAKGRVTLEGKVFRPLNVRSAFVPQEDKENQV